MERKIMIIKIVHVILIKDVDKILIICNDIFSQYLIVFKI